MASLPAVQRKALLASLELTPLTPNTFTDPALLADELGTIRKDGYSLDREEFHDAMVAIAVPGDRQQGSLLCRACHSRPDTAFQPQQCSGAAGYAGQLCPGALAICCFPPRHSLTQSDASRRLPAGFLKHFHSENHQHVIARKLVKKRVRQSRVAVPGLCRLSWLSWLSLSSCAVPAHRRFRALADPGACRNVSTRIGRTQSFRAAAMPRLFLRPARRYTLCLAVSGAHHVNNATARGAAGIS